MLFLALRYMLWRKKQSALVVIGLALGTATFISISGMMLGMRTFILGQLIDNEGHIRITGRDESITEESINEVFYSEGPQIVHWKKPPLGRRGTIKIANPESWIETLEKNQNVMTYSPQTLVQVSFRNGSTSAFGKLIGCIPARQLATTTIGRYITSGNFNELSRGGNRIVLGDGLASKIGVTLKDSVLLSNGAQAPIPFKVAGLFHLGVRPMDDGTAYTLLGDAQRLNRTPGILTDISVKLLDPANAAAEASGWQILFPRENVLSWDQANAGFLSVFKIQDAIRYFLSLAFVLVESFGIYNILSILVAQKRKDIAIMKSLGFGKGKVIQVFLLQGMVFGMTGGMLGLLLGYLMCRAMEMIQIQGNAMYSTPGAHILVAYPVPIYVLSFFLTFSGALLSAALPARKAGQLEPIEIIRSSE